MGGSLQTDVENFRLFLGKLEMASLCKKILGRMFFAIFIIFIGTSLVWGPRKKFLIFFKNNFLGVLLREKPEKRTPEAPKCFFRP